ncbi:MAG: NAD(P)/FAD-dependent oxidoreductase [Polyangiaceae bacterium]|nr:NAD(P)/FAD-dependent oxidoreductase [Polyangiaceae bacterium]
MTTERAIIIGSGFAGLCAAIQLKKAGIDFTILERDEAIGGTWWANRYPGCACDVESHFYSYSFEPNPRFSRAFAPQAEILAYVEHCVEKYGLRPHVQLRTNAVGATFDESRGTWEVDTSDGRKLRARYLISGSGGLSRPSVPDIPGLSAFEGDSFHSARWRDGYDFTGKDVAVIGTGASSVQIVPEIARRVRKLYVFQRTPAWIIPRPDRAIGDAERMLLERFPSMLRAQRYALFARRELFWLGMVPGSPVGKIAARMARRHLRSVRDPELRRRLTPNYDIGCKRILLSNDFYPAIQRDNVELVTDPIESVVARGIRTAGGTTRVLDTVVLATGFHAADAVAPFSVRGRDGRDLATEWKDGAEAYKGTMVSGFPNLFLIVGPNTGLGHGSMIFMIESQVAYMMSAIRAMRASGAVTADVRADAQARYNTTLHERLSQRVWSTGGCKSWYQTASGKNVTLWPGTMTEFNLMLRKFDPEAYELGRRLEREHEVIPTVRTANEASVAQGG